MQVIKDPGNVLESIGQGMFDTADEKGIAYSAGYVTMDVVIAILTDRVQRLWRRDWKRMMVRY